MKKLKLTIASILLVFVGYILGTIIQPQCIGILKPDRYFQVAVESTNEDGDEIPYISVDKIQLVQDRIDEAGLKWTHAVPAGSAIEIVSYGFQPWSGKRVDENLRISCDILRELESEK